MKQNNSTEAGERTHLGCPFCGGKAVTNRSKFHRPQEHWVFCDNCGTCTAGFGSAESATKAWNNRVADAAATDLLQACKDMLAAEDALEGAHDFEAHSDAPMGYQQIEEIDAAQKLQFAAKRAMQAAIDKAEGNQPEFSEQAKQLFPEGAR